MRKPAICICENKDADQLHSNCKADQRLCFRHRDTPLPLISKVSSFQLYAVTAYSLVCVGPGRKPKLLVFSCGGSIKSATQDCLILLSQLLNTLFYFHIVWGFPEDDEISISVSALETRLDMNEFDFFLSLNQDMYTT